MVQMRKYEATRDIHFTISLDQLIEIDKFCDSHYKSSRNEGIRKLIEVGLTCINNWSKITNPEVLDQLHSQFEEGTIVDDIQKMQPKQFDVLYSIFTTEHKVRYGKQETLL